MAFIGIDFNPKLEHHYHYPIFISISSSHPQPNPILILIPSSSLSPSQPQTPPALDSPSSQLQEFCPVHPVNDNLTSPNPQSSPSSFPGMIPLEQGGNQGPGMWGNTDKLKLNPGIFRGCHGTPRGSGIWSSPGDSPGISNSRGSGMG